MVDYYYPNKMGRVIFLALEEVAGRTGMNAVLNLASLSNLIDSPPPNNMERKIPFGQLSRLQIALEQLYGPRGGRGVALRVGRAVFRYALREFGISGGMADLSFRLKPQEARLRDGARHLVEFLNQNSDLRVRMEEQPDAYLLHLEKCPVCWERHSDHPVCHLTAGFVQEALHWATGGKFFNVSETACSACGSAACTLQVDKNPTE